jgi:hypothetical protein
LIREVDDSMAFAPTSWLAYWLKNIMNFITFLIFLSG